MNNVKNSRFESQLCYALYKASRLVIQGYQESLEKRGLTYLQYMMLMLLAESGELSVKEAGKKLALDSGTLSPLLQKLEAHGLVQRAADPEDQRSVRVRLTPKGKNLERQTCGVSEALNASLGFAPAQARRFKGDLDELLEKLQKIKVSKTKGKKS